MSPSSASRNGSIAWFQFLKIDIRGRRTPAVVVAAPI
jgi:hypothetical protein